MACRYVHGSLFLIVGPEMQPNMPIMDKLTELGFMDSHLPVSLIWPSVKPAVKVFEQYKSVLDEIELPEEAKNYLN